GGQLWSVGLPAGFVTSSTEDRFGSAARAFDHRLLVLGQTTDGRPALAVLTDIAFTAPVQPVVTLADITTGPGIGGAAGPYTMADGSHVIVLTRGDTFIGQTEAGGSVELAVERADGWHI